MGVIVWVHGDALRRESAAFREYPTAPALFVWDDVVLRGYGVSLKRLVFMYECLLDLPVEMVRGDVATQLVAFATRHGADTIVTMDTPAPRFAQIVATLRQTHTVLILSDPPLVAVDKPVDLGRFSRFWQNVRPLLLRESVQKKLFDDV